MTILVIIAGKQSHSIEVLVWEEEVVALLTRLISTGFYLACGMLCMG